MTTTADAAWIDRNFGPGARPKARVGKTDPLPAFAASVRQQLHKRDREIEKLRRDVAELRAQLDTQARLTELQARLDRLEGQRGAHLRVAT